MHDYLELHHEIDFILDTFPFTGGTTTNQALWMGVPTLTLTGDTLPHRQGAGIMARAGLGEWVAQSEADFVARAVAISGAAACNWLRCGRVCARCSKPTPNRKRRRLRRWSRRHCARCGSAGARANPHDHSR